MSGCTYFGEEAAAALEQWQRGGRTLDFVEALPDGGSGARLAIFHHDGDADHPEHKLLIKLCAPDEGAVTEPYDLDIAWKSGPPFNKGARTFDFPDRRLVRQVYPPLAVGDTWLMFLSIALDDRGDHELTPLSGLTSPTERATVAAAVIRSVLSEWNPDPGADHTMSALEYLRQALGHRAAPDSRLARTATRVLGADAQRPHITLPGCSESLPNPLLFPSSPLAGLKPPTVALGRAHYDLHPANIMVETTPSLVPDAHRLVDLSRFQQRGLLARDPVHLTLCLVCDYLPELSERALNDLIELLTADAAPDPNEDLLPASLHSTIQQTRSAPDDWRLTRHYSLTDWRPQYLLALQACALMFVTRRAREREQTWFLELAARACAAFAPVAKTISSPPQPPPTTPKDTATPPRSLAEFPTPTAVQAELERQRPQLTHALNRLSDARFDRILAENLRTVIHRCEKLERMAAHTPSTHPNAAVDPPWQPVLETARALDEIRTWHEHRPNSREEFQRVRDQFLAALSTLLDHQDPTTEDLSAGPRP
ncbi:hypothetical protein [Streptomyces sp. HG99]|uniref:Aminoglycoside phosphotransferase domain-containing protein n=1 Tax=Streptomyces dengpaensis TaxID=2049881 RepID=A0ABM6SJJ5_9ACTN|nr:hypothetical protein [Streptomyces sp. HG99]AVH54561.1 hypothetical protein C4B68_00465 [Streptomyces dengpaensis]PIB03462.1 hypothetical protein B1C81_37230 [Streptomyces sp. HG99]